MRACSRSWPGSRTTCWPTPSSVPTARQWLETWLFRHVKTEDFVYCDWIVDAGLEARADAEMRNPSG
ncbi:MAG: hypothetical protein OXR84_14540 [Magnetovibrio sp.]|nr:hypothetical protein [Magnetovibrio sp.]